MGNRTDTARDEFASFVRAQVAALTRSAYLVTGDRQHAEDLVQVALARVAARWERLDDPAAYARRVLYTQAVNWWRRRGARVAETLTARPPEPAALSVEPEVAIVLRQALRRLTPRQRAVLVLRFYEDRTEVETAALMGCRVGTVKSQTRHALDRLRRIAPELADLAPTPIAVGGGDD